MTKIKLFLILLIVFAYSCSNEKEISKDEELTVIENSEAFYLGADLSYVNEMENC